MQDAQNLGTASSFSIEEDPFFAEDLRQMAKAVNYRQWQFDLIKPYLKGNVLEVGGGIGNFTPDLARVAEGVVSLEPNAFCHKQLVEKTRDLKNVRILNMTSEALDEQFDKAYRADTAVCMNVLEHIRDDEQAVRTFSKRLKTGGSLVLLIPAVPSLFGEIDKRLGHYRRYSKATVRELMGKTGMSIVKLQYFNFIGLWGWWWNARVTKRISQNDAQIHVFDNYIVPWLSKVENIIPPPIGQSLLVVAKKNETVAS